MLGGGFSRRVMVVVAILMWSGLASAQDKRVGVRFTGRGEGVIRDRVGQVIARHGFKIVSEQQLEATARSMKKGFGSPSHVAAIAHKLKLSAIVMGHVNAPEGKATIVVLGGANGSSTAEAEWSVRGGAGKLADAVGRSVWARIGDGLTAGPPAVAEAPSKRERRDSAEASPPADSQDEEKSSPSASAPKKDDPPSKNAAPEKTSSDDTGGDEDDDRSSRTDAEVQRKAKETKKKSSSEDSDDDGDVEGSGSLALDLVVGPRFLSRDLRYAQDTAPALLPFTIANRAAFGFALVWFPAAHVMSGWAANLGVVVNGEYASSFLSKTSTGTAFPTMGSDYFGGIRGRVPFGPVEVSATVGLGRHSFVFHSAQGMDRATVNVPDVDYLYLRVGAEGRVQLPANFALMAGGAYRNVLEPGRQPYQVRSMQYFPRATVMGLDVMAAVGYRIHPLIEARAGFDLRRYAYTTHAVATDPIPLAGFTDQYSAFWVSVAMVVDGQRGSGGSRGTARSKDTAKAKEPVSPPDPDDEE